MPGWPLIDNHRAPLVLNRAASDHRLSSIYGFYILPDVLDEKRRESMEHSLSREKSAFNKDTRSQNWCYPWNWVKRLLWMLAGIIVPPFGYWVIFLTKMMKPFLYEQKITHSTNVKSTFLQGVRFVLAFFCNKCLLNCDCQIILLKLKGTR